jgi:hypothetical protein
LVRGDVAWVLIWNFCVDFFPDFFPLSHASSRMIPAAAAPDESWIILVH